MTGIIDNEQGWYNIMISTAFCDDCTTICAITCHTYIFLHTFKYNQNKVLILSFIISINYKGY